MESLFTLIHVLGIIGFFAGLFVQLRDKKKQLSNMIVHGSLTAFVSGLILVIIKFPSISYIKIVIKFILMLVILGYFIYSYKYKLTLQNYRIISVIGLVMLVMGLLM